MTWRRAENELSSREEFGQGEDVALEFKEERPRDSLKYFKTVVAFANECSWRTVSDTPRQFG